MTSRFTIRQEDCPVSDDRPERCPLCGATVSGDDAFGGACQIASFIGRPIMEFVQRHAPTDDGTLERLPTDDRNRAESAIADRVLGLEAG